MLRRILGSPWLYYGAAGLLAVVAVLSQFRVSFPPRPVGTVADIRSLRDRSDLNLIFVMIDTLRADHMGSYGYERDTSPLMDDLAATGVRFAHVRAQSTWTKSSMASLWTGIYPFALGIVKYEDALSDSLRMPAEVLRDAGFTTAGFYRNGWVAPNFGFGQGFDLYLVPTPNLSDQRMQRGSPSSAVVQGSDYDVTEVAIEFLQSNVNRRFFLYLHLLDVHQYLYESSSALFGTRYVDAYDNAIHWTDRNVAEVVSSLIDLELFDRTVIAIASDHGEAFREHGLEGHAKQLYGETTLTPLILSLPFAIDGGLVVETPVENIDIWPTLYDVLGIEPPEGMQGRSLLPLMEAAAAGEESRSGFPGSTMAQLDKVWGKPRPPQKLVSRGEGRFRVIYSPANLEKARLFDLEADPGEQNDLAAEDPERLTEMLMSAEQLREQRPAQDTSRKVELDELELNQLRALGYAIEK